MLAKKESCSEHRSKEGRTLMLWIYIVVLLHQQMVTRRGLQNCHHSDMPQILWKSEWPSCCARKRNKAALNATQKSSAHLWSEHSISLTSKWWQNKDSRIVITLTCQKLFGKMSGTLILLEKKIMPLWTPLKRAALTYALNIVSLLPANGDKTRTPGLSSLWHAKNYLEKWAVLSFCLRKK